MKNTYIVSLGISLVLSISLFACRGGGGGGGGEAPKWTGTKQLGVASASTVATGAAVDSSGNVYVSGSTTGGLDGSTITGLEDFFLTLYDSSGNKVRTKQLGVASAFTVATGVAVDSSGNVYVSGSTTGGLDGNTITGMKDFFLTKYDSSGNKQ